MRHGRQCSVKASSRVAQIAFKRVLVTVDGSRNATRAARVAVMLAKKYAAELLVLHVIPRPSYLFPTASLAHYYRDAKKAAEKWVNSVVSLGKSQRLKVRGEVLGHAVSVVQAISGYAAEKKVNLIIIGTRGLSGFKRLAIGSTSTGVLNRAPCSVLVVR